MAPSTDPDSDNPLKMGDEQQEGGSPFKPWPRPFNHDDPAHRAFPRQATYPSRLDDDYSENLEADAQNLRYDQLPENVWQPIFTPQQLRNAPWALRRHFHPGLEQTDTALQTLAQELSNAEKAKHDKDVDNAQAFRSLHYKIVELMSAEVKIKALEEQIAQDTSAHLELELERGRVRELESRLKKTAENSLYTDLEVADKKARALSDAQSALEQTSAQDEDQTAEQAGNARIKDLEGDIAVLQEQLNRLRAFQDGPDDLRCPYLKVDCEKERADARETWQRTENERFAAVTECDGLLASINNQKLSHEHFEDSQNPDCQLKCKKANDERDALTKENRYLKESNETRREQINVQEDQLRLERTLPRGNSDVDHLRKVKELQKECDALRSLADFAESDANMYREQWNDAKAEARHKQTNLNFQNSSLQIAIDEYKDEREEKESLNLKMEELEKTTYDDMKRSATLWKELKIENDSLKRLQDSQKSSKHLGNCDAERKEIERLLEQLQDVEADNGNLKETLDRLSGNSDARKNATDLLKSTHAELTEKTNVHHCELKNQQQPRKCDAEKKEIRRLRQEIENLRRVNLSGTPDSEFLRQTANNAHKQLHDMECQRNEMLNERNKLQQRVAELESHEPEDNMFFSESADIYSLRKTANNAHQQLRALEKERNILLTERNELRQLLAEYESRQLDRDNIILDGDGAVDDGCENDSEQKLSSVGPSSQTQHEPFPEPTRYPGASNRSSTGKDHERGSHHYDDSYDLTSKASKGQAPLKSLKRFQAEDAAMRDAVCPQHIISIEQKLKNVERQCEMLREAHYRADQSVRKKIKSAKDATKAEALQVIKLKEQLQDEKSRRYYGMISRSTQTAPQRGSTRLKSSQKIAQKPTVVDSSCQTEEPHLLSSPPLAETGFDIHDGFAYDGLEIEEQQTLEDFFGHDVGQAFTGQPALYIGHGANDDGDEEWTPTEPNTPTFSEEDHLPPSRRVKAPSKKEFPTPPVNNDIPDTVPFSPTRKDSPPTLHDTIRRASLNDSDSELSYPPADIDLEGAYWPPRSSPSESQKNKRSSEDDEIAPGPPSSKARRVQEEFQPAPSAPAPTRRSSRIKDQRLQERQTPAPEVLTVPTVVSKLGKTAGKKGSKKNRDEGDVSGGKAKFASRNGKKSAGKVSKSRTNTSKDNSYAPPALSSFTEDERKKKGPKSKSSTDIATSLGDEDQMKPAPKGQSSEGEKAFSEDHQPQTRKENKPSKRKVHDAKEEVDIALKDEKERNAKRRRA